MVSKKNFQQNSRVMPQIRPNLHATTAPYNKKPYKTQMMFSASQIPDNPGYMDFNNPTPPIMNSSATAAHPPQQTQQSPQQQQKKKNNKNKQKSNANANNKPEQQQQLPNTNMQMKNNTWNKKQQQNLHHRFGNGMQRGFGPQINGPMRGRGIGGRMFGQRNGPMPPMPPPHGFQPPPIIPPMVPPPIGRGPMPGMPPMLNGAGPLPPPPFLRRSARNMPPIPPPMPPMLMPPRMPRGVIPPAVPFNNIGGKIKKPNPKLIKKVVKAKSSIKTLKNLINQYPIDKPWVTEEIRAEYNKKVDIENRLKGNKNDELFAEFKLQRDKFVAMYETAREEYLKQEAAAVKAKDGGNKDKQTNTKTAANNGNETNKDEIPKPNNASTANANANVVSNATT